MNNRRDFQQFYFDDFILILFEFTRFRGEKALIRVNTRTFLPCAEEQNINERLKELLEVP